MLSFIKKRRAAVMKRKEGGYSSSSINSSKPKKGIMKKSSKTTSLSSSPASEEKSAITRNHSSSSSSGHTRQTFHSDDGSSIEFGTDPVTVSERTQATDACSVVSSSSSSVDQPPQLPQRSRCDDDDGDVVVDYGYGDATPDSSNINQVQQEHSSNSRYGRPIRRASIQYTDPEPVANDGSNTYGYGDASPDASRYGYGDAAPDTSRYGYGDAFPDTSGYGYEDASPDTSKYGYGDATPDSDCTPRPPARRSSMTAAVGTHQHQRQPRRSSMKTSGAPRRSSIGYTGEKDVVLPGRRQVKRRTSISFDEQVKVRSVEPVTELAKNPEKLWFQAKDYEKMRRKSLTLAELVEKRGVHGFGDKTPCIRGLECLIGNEGEAKSLRRYDAYGVVMYEQHTQRNDGIFYDDVAMSKLYEETTDESKVLAVLRAKQDAKEIEQYTRETRKICRRLSM